MNSQWYKMLIVSLLVSSFAVGCIGKNASERFEGPEYEVTPALKIPGDLYAPVYREKYPIPGDSKPVTVEGPVNVARLFPLEEEAVINGTDRMQPIRKLENYSEHFDLSIYRVWQLVRLALTKHKDLKIVSEDSEQGQIFAETAGQQFRFDVWEEDGLSKVVVLTRDGDVIDNARVAQQLMDVATFYIKEQP